MADTGLSENSARWFGCGSVPRRAGSGSAKSLVECFFMRRLIVLGAIGVLLAACSVEQNPEPVSTSPETSPTGDVVLPPSPEPEVEESCPHVDTDVIARANGQRVTRVETSSGKPDSACFFYRADGDRQAEVRIHTGDLEVAEALVDDAAPIETSNPANDPDGWEGGYQSMTDGAVYAVARDGDAVIVTTNQKQSVKARRIAVEVISQLDDGA